ncbi:MULTISPECIES: alpha/beta hydrolase [Prauserella salsuginis group]|uniref:Acetyl esterase n=2 Tax=Prauserella salsuginis group TaxID=2893672 RepID=A0A839XZR1_9PSEU|nr:MULTISPECIES: alpha/beta hydrolase [Prauserella salsuginis group]MBB3665205.1 acetyl esterase [Prauserella sediminis]MCR3718669.1 acetyl esterase [Prauserella flava]MCR3733239.1 acetyl esterase [Prauserella salsuginis]
MALDEATSSLLAQLAESGQPPIHEMDPQQARGITAALQEMYGPGPDMARAETRSIDLPGRSVPVQILVPNAAPRGVIVYYHGGGWVIGRIEEFETLGRQLADRTGCAVVLVDYRLAPEHRYPAAADDAWDSLRWVEAHLDEIAGRRVPLIVAGDSAGGNLAAIVAQKARSGGPEISQQILVYPVTDCDFDNSSYADPENQLMVNREAMIWFWDHYADAEQRANADACPAKAGDLSGQAPAVVVTAEHDVLRDEGEAYAKALEAAGVPVRHRRFAGQMHGFFTMVNVLPGSAEAIAYVATEIDSQLSAAG